MRFKLGVLALLAAAAVVVPGSGAGTGASLSTDQAVYTYLASIGADPTDVVIQRGVRNYAGPDCPGLGWNCTTATAVVQIAPAGGENKVDCPQFRGGGTDDEVLVVQNANGGNNNVRCYQESHDTPAAVLEFTFAQSNTTGNNFLDVDQRIFQDEGSSQTATTTANLTQETDLGDNHLHLNQTIKQETSESGVSGLALLSAATQSQTGDLETNIDQDAGNNNYADFVQRLDENGTASGDVSQSQAGRHSGDVSQTAPEEGSGGNHFTAHQTERQVLQGDGAQSQFGPQFCCAKQIGNEQNSSLHIHQDSFQRANQENADQDSASTGTYDTSFVPDLTSAVTSAFDTGPSKFMILHHLANNVDRITAQESGPGAHQVVTTCQSQPEEYYEEAGCFSTAEDDELDLLEHSVPAIEWP